MTKNTKDNDKKPFDNQASNELKNKRTEENRQKGIMPVVNKSVDHL
ncbi:MAG: hypothetical protein K0R71_1252 [Bacillales bacterium]|jgi:hypothetical protein|nr:hypothetical protein [Bacillales bacterium]